MLALFGAAFRLGSSVPLFLTELVYQPPSGGIIPNAKSPESAAKRFYMLLDDGQYEEAYRLVVEPDWVEGDKPAPYRHSVAASADSYQGLVSKDEFLSRAAGEMGPRGIFFSLSHIKAVEEKNSEAVLPYEEVIEYPAYSSSSVVNVKGDYLASCAVYRWEKNIPVIKTASGYKLVLEGTKREKENYYLTWLNFAEKKLIKSLRGTPEEGKL